jgi:hypothetical protein
MIIPYVSALRVTNLSALPAGLRARYLVCLQAPTAAQGYIAKTWKRVLPRTIAPQEVIIDFGR